MASYFIDLPLRSVGSISAPGLASEATLQDCKTELQSISAAIGLNDVQHKIEHNYVSSPVTNAAYVQILAATTAAIVKMTLFDASGRAIVLATGGAGSENDYLYIPPGGFNGDIPVNIANGTRLSIKCLDTSSATAGKLIANLYKAV